MSRTRASHYTKDAQGQGQTPGEEGVGETADREIFSSVTAAGQKGSLSLLPAHTTRYGFNESLPALSARRCFKSCSEKMSASEFNVDKKLQVPGWIQTREDFPAQGGHAEGICHAMSSDSLSFDCEV